MYRKRRTSITHCFALPNLPGAELEMFPDRARSGGEVGTAVHHEMGHALFA